MTLAAITPAAADDLPAPCPRPCIELLTLAQAVALPEALRARARGAQATILVVRSGEPGRRGAHRVAWQDLVFDLELRGSYRAGEAIRITVPGPARAGRDPAREEG